MMKFDQNNDLPLKNILELHNMIIFVGFVFHGGKKYYPLVFLEACLYKL